MADSLSFEAQNQVLLITIANSVYICFSARSKSEQDGNKSSLELPEPADLTEISFGIRFLTLAAGQFG